MPNHDSLDQRIIGAMEYYANAYVATGTSGHVIRDESTKIAERFREANRRSHAEGFMAGVEWLKANGDTHITLTDAARSILAERAEQARIGYTADHDRQHSASQWYIILSRLLCEFGARVMNCDQHGAHRSALVKLAATTQAAIEATDTL